jgi:hypothetical protein
MLPEAIRTPAYLDEDALHPMQQGGSISRLLSNGSILRLLRRVLHEVRGYEHVLPMYPAVLCEPLDRLYAFRRASCTLDETLLQDLLFSYNWRQAHWGAWLAALCPDHRYAAHLETRRNTLPYGTTITTLAIRACRGTPVEDALSEHWRLLQCVRALLDQLPELKRPLRKSPTEEEQRILDAQFVAIRSAYGRGDHASVEAALRHPLLRHFLQSHLEWVRSRSKATT